jgi:molybdopterin-guanine dinucleotide biosynthesis protein MobB
MRLFGLAGWKRSGKTELMTRLLPALAARGLRVSAIKEARHDFDIDQPGKDSFLHRVAGASEVMLASSHRWALMQERRGRNDDPRLAEILDRMTPVDLVLVEGFRHENHRKLEVYRASNGKTLLAPGDPTIVGVASDVALDGLQVPVLGVDDIAAIAELVIAQCGLAGLATPPAEARRIQGGAGQS